MTQRHLLLVAAALAIAVVALGVALRAEVKKVTSFARQRGSICHTTLQQLREWARLGVHDEYGAVDAALNDGATEMCTGKVNPSSYECWMTAPDRARCFAEHVALWLRKFEQHESEWG